MPKKKKRDEEENSELEELIDEKKLKKIVQDIKEKSEEPVSSKTNIDKNQFQEFLQIKSSAPVLEEIAQAKEPINLEQDVATTSTTKEKDNQTNYSATDYQNTKQENYETTNPQTDNWSETNRPAQTDAIFRNPELNTQNTTQQSPENYQSKIKHAKREEKKLPFETRDRKYQ